MQNQVLVKVSNNIVESESLGFWRNISTNNIIAVKTFTKGSLLSAYANGKVQDK